MALLTAEDVLNKAFSKTKYREGFDQDEVDDFLDEVANAISALTAERDELQTRLAHYQAGGVPVSAVSVPTPVVSAAQGLSSASADLLAAATDPNPPSATTMLSMAQRLHDDYLQAGESERDRIVAEGKAKAEAIVEQAETGARIRMQSLESDRADLERRIDDLRRFERDYRGHLRNYLENLLGDLEHNSARGAVAAPGGEAPAAVTLPPLFGSASTEEPAMPAGDTVSDHFGFHAAEPEPYTPVAQPEPYTPIVRSEPATPVAQPEPYTPVAQPEPYTPIVRSEPATPVAQPEPYAPVVPSEPFVQVAQPEPYAPVVPSEPFVQVAQPQETRHHVDASKPESLDSFEETLPPFPGSSQMASPFGLPFKDSNPFAPVEPSVAPSSPGVDPRRPVSSEAPAGEEEAPRWNF